LGSASFVTFVFFAIISATLCDTFL